MSTTPEVKGNLAYSYEEPPKEQWAYWVDRYEGVTKRFRVPFCRDEVSRLSKY